MATQEKTCWNLSLKNFEGSSFDVWVHFPKIGDKVTKLDNRSMKAWYMLHITEQLNCCKNLSFLHLSRVKKIANKQHRRQHQGLTIDISTGFLRRFLFSNIFGQLLRTIHHPSKWNVKIIFWTRTHDSKTCFIAADVRFAPVGSDIGWSHRVLGPSNCTPASVAVSLFDRGENELTSLADGSWK